MAIYKRGREFELGTTEHKSSKGPERDSNPGPPDCESDALTTRPRCLPNVSNVVRKESVFSIKQIISNLENITQHEDKKKINSVW